MKTQRHALAAALHSVKKGDAVTINGRTFTALEDGGDLFDVAGPRGGRYGVTINLKHRNAYLRRLGSRSARTDLIETVGDVSLDG